MENLYEKIEELNPNSRNTIATVIEGNSAGEKALFSDSRLIWESASQGFFTANSAAAAGNSREGLTVIEGNTVFYELLGREKRIVICGGGHVSIPIIQLGLMIGCPVTVLEDRPQFAEHASQAGATKVICDSFENGLAQIPGDTDTFFIIVTRGHRSDQLCLKLISQKDHAYIGMMGSRTRVSKVKESLLADGVDEDILDSLHAPIGLDIKAETPQEIAVAVMAEIIAVKNSRTQNCGYTRELKHALRQTREQGDRAVLATIIKRKGSAPRKVGTKMLIFPDGSTTGTIGGGCAEAAVIQKAVQIMERESPLPMTHQIDITGRTAEDEGMVCGGIVDFLLERV